MRNINGVPQISMNGVEIVNGSRIVVPTPNEIATINGVPQTAMHGIESLNGALKSEISTSEWPNFGGWQETDPNGYLSVDDASAFDAIWTIGNGVNPIQGAGESYMRIYVDAGSAFFDGDFTINYRVIVYDRAATTTIIAFGLYSELVKLADVSGHPTVDAAYHSLFEVGGSNVSGTGAVFLNGVTEGSLTWAQSFQELGNSIYVTMERSGTAITVKAWKSPNSSRSGAPDWTGTRSPVTVVPYRYLYLFNMADYSTVKVAQVQIQMESITPNPWA